MSRKTDLTDHHLGQRIRLRRRDLHLSQADLGRALGVTYQQAQKIETGTNRISAANLLKAARALGVPVGYFYEDLPEAAHVEPILDRQRRSFAQSPRGAALLEAAMHLPPEVVMAHVEALQAVGAAISVASVGPKQDPVS